MLKLRSEIFEEYAKKRIASENELRRKKLDLYISLPEIEAIDGQIAALSLDFSRKVLESSLSSSPADVDKMMSALKEKIESLKASKAFILTENSLSMNYLTPTFECKECKDTGYLPDKSYCRCFRQRLSMKLYDMSNISRTMDLENFDTFNISIFSSEPSKENGISPRENMQDVLKSSYEFINSFKDNVDRSTGENLLLYGSTGLGKTFLCNAIAKSIIDQGYTVVYQTSYRIIEILEKVRFRSSKFDNSSNESLQYELLNDCDLLIIDDLGTELVNSFTNSEMFNIINSRILSGKSVIISTNLSPQELMDTYSNRISSRLFGGFKMIKFFGHDLRWENMQK